MDSINEKETWRLCTSPQIHRPSNLLPRRSVGDFVMPMWFNGIAGFEKLNKTQASVFMFHNNWLVILLGSKKDHLIIETGLLFTLTGYYFSIQFGEVRFLLFRIVFLSKTFAYLNFCFSGMILMFYSWINLFCLAWNRQLIQGISIFFSAISVWLLKVTLEGVLFLGFQLFSSIRFCFV